MREIEPRYLVVDKRHSDPECGHYRTAKEAYDDLAFHIMHERRVPMDTDAELDRHILIHARLARWLAWRDALTQEAK
jgi:hypothetical protein